MCKLMQSVILKLSHMNIEHFKTAESEEMFVLPRRLPDQAEVPAVQPRPQQLLRPRPTVGRVVAAVGGAGGGQHAGEAAALGGLLLQLDHEPGTNTIYIIYTDTSPPT